MRTPRYTFIHVCNNKLTLQGKMEQFVNANSDNDVSCLACGDLQSSNCPFMHSPTIGSPDPLEYD
jgi:hypothetical protein